MLLSLALAPLAVGQSCDHGHWDWDKVLQNHVGAIGEREPASR